VNKEEFATARKKLNKTQKMLATLLGVSLKTIHSYEQGWRTIPSHVERQIYFLLVNQRTKKSPTRPCWEIKKCLLKNECPAWEFQSGHLCWFLFGTLCDCGEYETYKEKIAICKTCKIFKSLLR